MSFKEFEYELQHISVAAKEAKERIIARSEGKERNVRTPWTKFNNLHYGGIDWGQLITIGGMSGAGKTMIMSQFYRELHALNPEQYFIILLFNFEMTGTRLIFRDVTASTGISRDKLMSAEGSRMDTDDLSVMEDFFNSKLFKRPIYLMNKPCTPEQFVKIKRDTIERTMEKNPGCKIITFSDFAGLFKNNKGNDNERGTLVDLASASMECKNEGWSTDVILTQLNRDIEDPGRRIPGSPFNYPQKSDVFGGDALYQMSDTFMVTHRPYILRFSGNTYGPERMPTGPQDIYWHFLKLRDYDAPYEARMMADFSNMRILDGKMH